MDRIYLRHSTDKQTDARQRHALAALLKAGAPVYDDPATSSRQLSLDRAGFSRLLHEAAVGDTIRIADAARLFRSVADILALRPVLIRRGLHLRVESGLLSGIDLAADDPGTKMMVNVLASVLTKEIHASRGAAAYLNHARTCGFACGSGPRWVLA